MRTVKFSLAVAFALFLAPSHAQEPALPDTASSAQAQSGVRAGFWWADYDHDGLDDAFVVGADAAARLLRNSGDGSFADVTLLSGLDGLGAASFAAWNDYDRDGAPDVFVGTQSGPGHLMRNAGDGTFQDVTQFVGLLHAGRHLAAQWFDYDLDGLSDLSVRTEAGEHLYHALPNGHFVVVDLGSAQPRPMIELSYEAELPASEPGSEGSVPGASDKREGRRPTLGPPSSPASIPVGTSRTAALPPPGNYLVSACPPRIENANVGGCLQASTLPTLGMLYPLSINLNVSGAGRVGIGTLTPAAKLDVVGTARMSDTLTLNPSGDHALDIDTGSVYMGGLLFAHAKGAGSNTAIGQQALANVTSGTSNTAGGNAALYANTTGFNNVAVGSLALRYNSSGPENTASGFAALFSNTSGASNTASGALALVYNTTGSFNTASGSHALFSNTTGAGGTAGGNRALYSNTTGSDNTASGNQALRSNLTGSQNTASGSRALYANTTGYRNTAHGSNALLSTTSGGQNTASGYGALSSNTTGRSNSAFGNNALQLNTSGYSNNASGKYALRANTTGIYNTACGFRALFYNTTGSHNIALGKDAGALLTTGDLNISIGHPGVAGDARTIRVGSIGFQNRTFIAGIRGETTGVANAIPVVVDSQGQLGTVSSSRRFKQDIVDMGDATENLLKLRPVRFRYKQEQTMPDGSEVPMEYGLIAEEVAEIFPDLVVYGDDGKPFTVKYHILSSMLLNEMVKQAAEIEQEKIAHARDLEDLRRGLAKSQEELTRLHGLEARFAALEARTAVAATSAVVPAGIR